MSGTIYAKLDCYSHKASNEDSRNAQETWVNFWRFMETLESASYVQRIAYNTGGLPGVTTGTNYWDESNPFGTGSFGVWKWLTSSNRKFEWYMYAQFTSGSSVNLVDGTPEIMPGKCYNTRYNAGSSTTCGLQFASAICWGNTSSFNPWNGTLGQGNAAKGSPVWVSGSNNRHLAVFPRSNNVRGLHQELKENMVSFSNYYAFNSAPFNGRYHFFADRDGIFMAIDNVFTPNPSYNALYIGDFKLRDALTGSAAIVSGSRGLIMLASSNRAWTPSEVFVSTDVVYGDINGTDIGINGGIYFGHGTETLGCQPISYGANIDLFQPATFINNSIDEYNITVACKESPHYGTIGYIDSPLIRYSAKGASHDMTFSGDRVWLAGGNAGMVKMTIPWSGSFPPGTSTSRTGSLVTISPI